MLLYVPQFRLHIHIATFPLNFNCARPLFHRRIFTYSTIYTSSMTTFFLSITTVLSRINTRAFLCSMLAQVRLFELGIYYCGIDLLRIYPKLPCYWSNGFLLTNFDSFQLEPYILSLVFLFSTVSPVTLLHMLPHMFLAVGQRAFIWGGHLIEMDVCCQDSSYSLGVYSKWAFNHGGCLIEITRWDLLSL